MVFGTAILGNNSFPDGPVESFTYSASSTFDFSYRGDLLLGLVDGGGEFSIIINGVQTLAQSFISDTVINLGSDFGPNIDLTMSSTGRATSELASGSLHKVSVTFLRWGGWSGSRPRWRAVASAWRFTPSTHRCRRRTGRSRTAGRSHAQKSPHGFTPAARRPAGYPDPAQRRALDIVLSAIRELALWAEASYACRLGKGLRPRLVEVPLAHRLTARVATPLNWRFGCLLLTRPAQPPIRTDARK
jgi:hypothetical protein